jgi:hypothetical protein
MAYQLKPNSIPNEYYLGDLPGTLQYSKSKAELTSISNIDQVDDRRGYVQLPVSNKLLQCLVPNTATGRKGDWELLLAMQSTNAETGETWLKGALLNKKTGLIALMSSTNAEANITGRGNRAMRSCAEGWFIGRYRMGAPMCFWQAVAEAARKCC